MYNKLHMLILILFAFLGGIVTILSPCILPILPIVLSGSITGGKRRPYGVVTGFIASFTFFTLFLSAIVRATGVSPDVLRIIAVVVISLFGLSLLIPKLQVAMEAFFSHLASKGATQQSGDGFVSGLLVGASLGLVWTPCVGPILAAIIALAATQAAGLNAVLITLSYAFGTSIPLLAITFGGRKLLTEHPWLVTHTQGIQKTFGILMLLTAIAIFFSWDRAFQTFVLERFPSYGTGLTAIEDNSIVRQQLDALKKSPGPAMTDLLQSTYGPAPEFVPGGRWFNTPTPEGFTMASLKGKVVVVDFWTYTCINCIRTLPYTKAWWEKYKDKGLVFIGVHTPEFEFEKNPDNVARAIKDFGITYPVMQDNAYGTWNAYSNQYWPAEYFIDKDGRIRYTHFGEGNYDESEQHIQDLLAETGVTVEPPISNQEYQIYARTPETYLGYARSVGLSSPERVTKDKDATYSIPTVLPANSFALGGTWHISEDTAMPGINASLVYSFNAKNVYLVMRPHTPGAVSKVKITLDDASVGTSGGKDIVNGIVTVDSDRLYDLIDLATPGAHVVKLEFLDDNIEVYAFTFG
jgi:cytochrome c biogenesis protein CcdA/thiol-disulfide isomerase/thioredoxin